ncbi:hypothetical protein RRG08_067194, partial [Elysia crispata]
MAALKDLVPSPAGERGGWGELSARFSLPDVRQANDLTGVTQMATSSSTGDRPQMVMRPCSKERPRGTYNMDAKFFLLPTRKLAFMVSDKGKKTMSGTFSGPACLTEVYMVDRGISALRTCLSHGSLHGGPRNISSQNLLVSRKSTWWTEVYQLSEPACLTEVSMVDRGISALRTCLSHGSLHGGPRYISSQNLLVSRKSTWWTELYQLSEPACLTEVYMVDRAISALRTCLSHGSLHGGPRYISSQNLLVSRKSPWWTEVYQLSEPACLTEVSMVDRGISALRTCLSHGSFHGGPRYISSQNLLVSRKSPWWTEVYQLSEPACLTEVSMVDRGISALRTCLSHGSLPGGQGISALRTCLSHGSLHGGPRYISAQNLLVSRKSTSWTEVYQRSEPACLTEVYIVDRGISALRTCLSHGSLHRGPRYISAQNLLVSRKSTSWTEVYQRSEPACLTEVSMVDKVYQLSEPACLTEVSMVTKVYQLSGPACLTEVSMVTKVYQLSGPACLTEASMLTKVEYLDRRFKPIDIGPSRKALTIVIPITIIYTIIFITGIIGNVCTCVVIVKNKYMRTVTNYYLFNLSVSDLLLLIIGLPHETYDTWHSYPYLLGETFCRLRYLASETSGYVSILTITAFTVERYMAICHPIRCPTQVRVPSVTKYASLLRYVYHLSPNSLAYQGTCTICHPIRCPTQVCVPSVTQCAALPRYVYHLSPNTLPYQGTCTICHQICWPTKVRVPSVTKYAGLPRYVYHLSPNMLPTKVRVPSVTQYAGLPRYVYHLSPNTLAYQGTCIICYPIRWPTKVRVPSVNKFAALPKYVYHLSPNTLSYSDACTIGRPLRCPTQRGLSRPIRVILCVWVMSVAAAIPMALQVGIDTHRWRNQIVPGTQVCATTDPELAGTAFQVRSQYLCRYARSVTGAGTLAVLQVQICSQWYRYARSVTGA